MGALLAPIFLSTPTLAPGRYAGEAAAGRVWLVLEADGAATFGGVPCRWHQIDDALHLEGEAPLVLRLDADGRCLTGPPFGRVCLRRIEVAEPPPPPPRVQPSALVGAWQHTASGAACGSICWPTAAM
ncbi:MAG: hypothetical protein R3F43_17265 [bacterium]